MLADESSGWRVLYLPEKLGVFAYSVCELLSFSVECVAIAPQDTPDWVMQRLIFFYNVDL